MESSSRGTVTWIVYSSIYVICFVWQSLFLWLYLDAWRLDSWIPLLADVAGGSLGVALLSAILWEVTRYMVLFAPRRIKQLKDEARRENNAEWEAWLKRRDEAREKNEPFDEPSPSQRN